MRCGVRRFSGLRDVLHPATARRNSCRTSLLALLKSAGTCSEIGWHLFALVRTCSHLFGTCSRSLGDGVVVSPAELEALRTCFPPRAIPVSGAGGIEKEVRSCVIRPVAPSSSPVFPCS